MSDLIQKELSIVISKIVNIIIVERGAIETELQKWKYAPESIEKLGRMAELKIKQIQINRIQKDVSKILNTSQNLILLSTINPKES